jgi:hypothetical protein
MIDFTTVQTFEVLPDVALLNAKNVALNKENRMIKVVFASFLFIVIGTGLYLLANNQYKNGERETQN